MGEMEHFRGETRFARYAGLERRGDLDPGIDFAKQREDDLTVFRSRTLAKMRRPVLVPVRERR